MLGYLNPGYFAGGALDLEPKLAQDTIEKLSKQLGLSVIDAALGIHRILNAQMADAIRLVTINRGHDPRKFTLVAFGGAGAVHSAVLARLLHIPRVIVPVKPGTLSAFGLLVADIEYDGVKSFHCAADKVDCGELEAKFRGLEAKGLSRLQAEGHAEDQLSMRRSMDMRYRGQSFELRSPSTLRPTNRRLPRPCSSFIKSTSRSSGIRTPHGRSNWWRYALCIGSPAASQSCFFPRIGEHQERFEV